MMTPFFHTPERIARLRSVIESWRGTPFVDHVGRKGAGGGCDCVHFALQVLVESGQMPAIDWPRYTVRYGGVPMLEAWRKWVVEHEAGYEVTASAMHDPSTLCAGDVVMFHGTKVGNHVGIVLDAPKFWHSLIRYGVIESTLADESYRQFVRHIWRPAVGEV